MAIQLEDIHDQASLDQYWAENGGPPLTVKQERSLAAVKEAIVQAAMEWRISLASGDSGIVLAAAVKLLKTLEMREHIIRTREIDERDITRRIDELKEHPARQLLGRRLGFGDPEDPHELLPSS